MKKEIEVREFQGKKFNVVVPSSIGLGKHTLWTFDDHEPVLDRISILKPGDLFVDIGAAFGSYTMPALALGARVVAFEPSDDGWDILNANIDVNEGFRERATLSRLAVFDGGPLPEMLAREVFCDHYPSARSPNTTKLDEFLPPLELGAVRVMKLDVEGAELGVLQGAVQTLKRDRPYLVIEDHDGVNPNPSCLVSEYPKSINSSQRIQELLKGLGYELEVVRWAHDRRYILAK